MECQLSTALEALEEDYKQNLQKANPLKTNKQNKTNKQTIKNRPESGFPRSGFRSTETKSSPRVYHRC